MLGKSQIDIFGSVSVANGSVLCVDFHCKWVHTSVGASMMVMSSSQEGFKGRKRQWGHLASLEISLTCLSTYPTRTKDPFDSGHHVPDNYIWNASESTLSPYIT